MRKALLPMIASLALCGAATVALIATNARADQSAKKPMMMAPAGQGGLTLAAAAPEGGPTAAYMMKDDGTRHAQFCKDMYAHRAGEMAFLEAKLSLNAGQQPLFDRWKRASLDIAKAHESDCSTLERHKPGEHASAIDQMNLEESMLKRRLADIEAEKPVLTAFYNSLSPQQKQEFGHAAMDHMGERVHMMMGMMGAPHPGMGGNVMFIRARGPMGGPMGPIGPGPIGPGSMGDAPPPPQAQ
jgi:hypothetical protein